MRIVRCLDSSGAERWGVVLGGGLTHALKEDPLKSLEITDEVIEVQKLLAPIRPDAILCIGLNYRKHAEETGSKLPEYPILFMKHPASLQNPFDPIVLPRTLRSDRVDYEAELAVVIGRAARNVSRDEALDYVFGYTCANDVSARDWQKMAGGGQWTRGKTFDSFCPLGPVLVTQDEILNPSALQIQTRLNGELMQHSNTGDMIFDVPSLIAFLSASTTLTPGTVILTGTPEGVGMARDPRVWLQAGDEVSIEIEGIGTLTNPVIEEAL